MLSPDSVPIAQRFSVSLGVELPGGGTGEHDRRIGVVGVHRSGDRLRGVGAGPRARGRGGCLSCPGRGTCHCARARGKAQHCGRAHETGYMQSALCGHIAHHSDTRCIFSPLHAPPGIGPVGDSGLPGLLRCPRSTGAWWPLSSGQDPRGVCTRYEFAPASGTGSFYHRTDVLIHGVAAEVKAGGSSLRREPGSYQA